MYRDVEYREYIREVTAELHNTREQESTGKKTLTNGSF